MVSVRVSECVTVIIATTVPVVVQVMAMSNGCVFEGMDRPSAKHIEHPLWEKLKSPIPRMYANTIALAQPGRASGDFASTLKYMCDGFKSSTKHNDGGADTCRHNVGSAC